MRAVYINLDTRTDRRMHIEAECARLGIAVERFPACRNIGPGQGCSQSHLEVLKLARDRGYPSVLVLEDDFECIVPKETFDDILANLPEDYDVVMLAYNLMRGEPFNDRFGRVLDAQNAAGYIVHARMYDRLIANLEDGLRMYLDHPAIHWLYQNDQVWKALQPESRWYYTTVRVGRQRPGYSDLAGAFRDYGT